MIADNITAQGISTTRNQVEEIRLKNGWRRRANNEEQLAEMRALTFTTNVLNLPECGLIITFLPAAIVHLNCHPSFLFSCFPNQPPTATINSGISLARSSHDVNSYPI
jgi:hypothetical protein